MIIALNNKSNLTKEEFLDYQKNLMNINTNNKLILCPTMLNIAQFNLNNFELGSQNVSATDNGAYTGEISSKQLKSFNVKYCIVGHSERRKNQKETNQDINEKIVNLFKENIIPILCVGETHDERKKGLTSNVISKEINEATSNLTPAEKNKLIVAYEPIWAIGTGEIPTNEKIKEVLETIKQILPESKLLYGGSANEKNIEQLNECKIIDGYLLGGLSLKPELLKIFLEKIENNS